MIDSSALLNHVGLLGYRSRSFCSALERDSAWQSRQGFVATHSHNAQSMNDNPEGDPKSGGEDHISATRSRT